MAQRIALQDICKIYDGPHATPTKTIDGPIYLGIDAITEDGKLDSSQFAHLSEADYLKWTKRVTPQYGDIVFSYEATLGRYALIPEEFYGCLGRRLAVIRNTSLDVDTTWLYYYFRSPEWTNFIQSKIVKGSTVNRLSIEDFPSYTIPKVPIESQKRIAHILSCIDKKIHDNDAVNDNLEHQLQDIYNYWFTQFDFPDVNGQPYKSSGGAMVWNEQLKRKIPANWQLKQLSEVCAFRNGINYDKDVAGDKTYRIINVRNISSSTTLLSEDELDEIILPQKHADKYCVAAESIIIARSGIPGATRILYRPSANTIFCGFIICGTPTESNMQYYLMLLLKQLEGSSATQTGGSILKNVSQDTLGDLLVPIPPKDVLAAFNHQAIQALDLIHNNLNESVNLRKLRDWLLPMLMNGQATVSD